MNNNLQIPMKDSDNIDIEALMQQDVNLLKLCAVRMDTPPVVLARLSCHENKKVRLSVAQNIHTPKDVLAVLSDDKEPDVIRAVAQNPSTPSEVLGRLVIADYTGHINALKNPNTPLVDILMYTTKKIDKDAQGSLNFNSRFSELIEIAREKDIKELFNFESAVTSSKLIEENNKSTKSTSNNKSTM